MTSVILRLKYALKYEDQLKDFMSVISDLLSFHNDDELWSNVLKFDYSKTLVKDYQAPCIAHLLGTFHTRQAIVKFIDAISDFSKVAFKELPSESAALMSRLSDSQDFGL